MKTPHPTTNSLPETTRGKVAAILNQLLADLSDLYSQTKQAHWNIRGHHFYSLHKMFDDLAAVVVPHIDAIAERVTALGAIAKGTARLAAENSRLPEFPIMESGDMLFVAALIQRYATCANETRKAIDETDGLGDATTADLLTGVSQELDKALWMLEAHGPKGS
jgi:starvation-inducible DNA-binding protein